MNELTTGTMAIIVIVAVLILLLTSSVGFALIGMLQDKLPRYHRWSCTCGAWGMFWARAGAPLLAIRNKATFHHKNLLQKEHVLGLFGACPHRITTLSKDAQFEFDCTKP